MKNNILLEVNRMNRLMGLSNLITEGVEPQLVKFLEKVFTTGGEKGIEKVVTKVEQEVTDAIQTLERQKNYGGVPTQEIDKAYETIVKNMSPEQLVKYLKDYKLLGSLETNFKTLSNKLEQQGSTLDVWEKSLDEYMDEATSGMDPELRNALKNEFKKDIPSGLKKSSALTGEILDKMKAQYPELFEMKWFGMIEKYPEKVKALKNQIQSELQGLTKEQVVIKIKKDADEMVQAVKKSKLSDSDKNTILSWWSGLSTGKKVFKILTTALAIYLIKNIISTGSFFGGIGKTGVEIGKDVYKGAKEGMKDSTTTTIPPPTTGGQSQQRKSKTLTADDL